MTIKELRTFLEERLKLMREIDDTEKGNTADFEKEVDAELAKFAKENNLEINAIKEKVYDIITQLLISKKKATLQEMNLTLDKNNEMFNICRSGVKFKYLKECIENFFKKQDIDCSLDVKRGDPIYFNECKARILGYKSQLTLKIKDEVYKLETNNIERAFINDEKIYLYPLFNSLAWGWREVEEKYPDIVDAYYQAIQMQFNEGKEEEISLIRKRIEERNAQISDLKNPDFIQSKIDVLADANTEDEKEIAEITESMLKD